MPNIKPISDLRNYNEVLRDVEEGSPVFLTKNGRGKYAIVELRDYEKAQATIRLMSEIAKGRRSGEEEGWLSVEEVEKSLGITHEKIAGFKSSTKRFAGNKSLYRGRFGKSGGGSGCGEQDHEKDTAFEG